MEQTNSPRPSGQQAGSAVGESTQPQRSDGPTATERTDSTTPPTDDTGFEPV